MISRGNAFSGYANVSFHLLHAVLGGGGGGPLSSSLDISQSITDIFTKFYVSLRASIVNMWSIFKDLWQVVQSNDTSWFAISVKKCFAAEMLTRPQFLSVA